MVVYRRPEKPLDKRFFFPRSGFSAALEKLAEDEPHRYTLLMPDDLFASIGSPGGPGGAPTVTSFRDK